MDESFSPPEFPKSDDRLFRDDCDDWKNNALLTYFLEKFSSYADGYKEGAENLVKACMEGFGTKDILIYPMVFLYRQYIELRLKELIIGLNYCIHHTNDFPRTHNISHLWNLFKKVYSETGEDSTTEEFCNTEKLIKEFSQIDPVSMAFRYPVDREGNEILHLEVINIRNLGDVMSRISSFLDAASWQIAEFKTIAGDLYRDFYSEMVTDYMR